MGVLSFLKRFVHTFQFRLFVALALMILVFIPILGYFSYLQGKTAIEVQIEKYADSTANQITGRIQAYLSHHTSNVRLMKTFLENRLIDRDDHSALIRYFHVLKQDHPGFVNILYGAETGEFIMVPPQPPEVHTLFDPRTRPWYAGAVRGNGLFWTPVYLFASTRKPGITASLPIVDDRGQLLGVCGIDIDLSTFSAFLARLRIGRAGTVSIIENSSDHIVAHPDLTDSNPDTTKIGMFSSCLADLRATGRQSGVASCGGDRYFTAYADYPDNDWTVYIMLPESEYLQDINTIKKTTITLTLAAIFLASVVSYLLSLTVIRPMAKLQQGIETISRGNLDLKVVVDSPDMVGSMASAVNDMAAALSKSRVELKHTLADLAEKEKMAALGQLTAGIAHEIKNPLGIILGSAEVMNNPKKPLQMRERAARFVIDEVVRLNKTLKRFLIFAKPSPPQFEVGDVQLILEDTLAFCDERLRQHAITVEKKFLPLVPACRIDPDQIRQVFMNLILNAIDAMPGGGRLNILTRVQKSDESLLVMVTDNGMGVSDAQRLKMFEPFCSFKDEGTGLGLAIVVQILKMHQVSIHVESVLRKGTKFTLSFPCSGDA